MNALIIFACMCSAAVAVAGHQGRTVGSGQPWTGLAMGLWLLGIGLGIVTLFRHRAGWWLALALSVPPLFLPLDALPALIVAASVVVSDRDARRGALAFTAATIATFVSLFRDTRSGPYGSSFFNDVFTPTAAKAPHDDMPLAGVLLLTLLIVGAFALIALLRRAKRQGQNAVTQAQQAQAANVALQDEVADQVDRADIAREVHDVLGHRLSLLSMQANALQIEAEASADPDVVERAHQIQQGAQGSMEDLRALIHMLNDPSGTSARGGQISDIQTLVQECMDAGTPVISSIFVDTSTPLNPVVSTSAHRIAGELLTNARKHSPGQTVRLKVVGSPGEGITIETVNPTTSSNAPYPVPQQVGIGAGTGLDGIQRRCAKLGGSFTTGVTPDGRQFTATARLPWTTE